MSETMNPEQEALSTYVRPFAKFLRAANRSDATVEKYVMVATQFCDWLGPDDGSFLAETTSTQRRRVEGFVAWSLESRRASTANTRYQSLIQFFKYLVREEILDDSPMTGMTPPIVPEEPVPVPDAEFLPRLLKSCAGKDFESRRDYAILRLFIDTGMRLSELTNLTLDDVDLDQDVAIVMGKGRRPRTCPFGNKTSLALERYLRARNSRQDASHSPWFWLGLRGQMSSSGVRQVIWRRTERVGERLHPHQLRHYFAHDWLANGGEETDLMRLMGWRSRTMLSHYAASTGSARAVAAHRRMGRGDTL
jgi:site-specific recombinase XerD